LTGYLSLTADRRTRPRHGDEPDYVREDVYIERGKGPGPRDLVFRGRDDSVEEISRDFPPPGRSKYDDYGPRRTRSVGRGGRYDDDNYDDDRNTDYAAPAAGAAAGYAAGRRRERRRRRDDRDYDSENSDISPPRRDRRKSGVGDVLEGLGLGGLAGAVLGKKDRPHSGSRDRRSVRSRSRARSRRGYSSDDYSRSRSRVPNDKRQTERKWAQAAQAALIAGAVEAFWSRKESGPWTGEKGKRVATAALGAGGIDGFLDRNPEKKTKRHLAEAVIGGLAATRLANGPRSKSRGRGDRAYSPDEAPRSRSRSIIDRLRGRSQSRGRSVSEYGESQGGKSGGDGAIKGLVAGGALAAAGTALYNRMRSKSRNRGGSRSRDSSADSYVPSRNRRRDRQRSPPSDTGTHNTRRSLQGTDRGRDRGIEGSGGGGSGGGAAAAAGAAGGGAAAANGSRKDSSSDESDTTDMENKRKHMRVKELLTAGLATIATIHAAHGVYSSMEAHEKRHRLVAEGEMSPEEARKKQTKAWVQDAAAVGIAALGIKGAFSEWKEMNEQRYIQVLPSFPGNFPLIVEADHRTFQTRST